MPAVSCERAGTPCKCGVRFGQGDDGTYTSTFPTREIRAVSGMMLQLASTATFVRRWPPVAAAVSFGVVGSLLPAPGSYRLAGLQPLSSRP